MSAKDAMKVVVLGGTRFIGRALVEDLIEAGHNVLLVHGGRADPDPFPEIEHIHTLRKDLAAERGKIEAFAPDVLIDMFQFSRATATATLEALPARMRRIVVSSMDVYDAYGALNKDEVRGAVPVDESGPVRTERFPYRGKVPNMDDYEKLDVEEEFKALGGTVCRLPIVYGEHDYQRREEFILRRVRAGRDKIPFGSGNWLTSRGYVRDVARGIRLAAESASVEGETFNLGEERTLTVELWARAILKAAASDAELVRVPDHELPEDLGSTKAISQHLLVDSNKARRELGWQGRPHEEGIAASVRWHLENPPPEPNPDFTADDEALTKAL